MQGDALNLSGIEDNSIPVLTCLHAVEHFGLGRYGDSVDYNGWRKALLNFQAKVCHGGSLIVSVPCGNADVLVFNAHRIFTPLTIYEVLRETMVLASFTSVQNYALFTTEFSDENKVSETLGEIAKSLGSYDCGIFVFRKK